MTPLVMTLIGDDRPGLINAAAQAVAANGGTWLESRLARLSGKFAGIVLIGAPPANVDKVMDALRRLEIVGLKVAVERGGEAAAPTTGRSLELEIVGHERPGIVRDLTDTLNKLGVNIEEFSSDVESAPFSGVEMFRAKVSARLPDTLSLEQVTDTLERLAGEIMVDLKLGDETQA
jgi:glycine cleavage system regulatory protein